MEDNYQYYDQRTGDYYMEIEEVQECYCGIDEPPELYRTKPSRPKDHFTGEELAANLIEMVLNEEPLIGNDEDKFGIICGEETRNRLAELIQQWLDETDIGIVQPDLDRPVEYKAELATN